MATSTAIGSASVILSANADGLMKGFDKAAKQTAALGTNLVKGVDRAATQAGGGGGLFGKILGGGAIGGAAGIAASLTSKVLSKLGDLPDIVERLRGKAGSQDAGFLDGIGRAFDRVTRVAEKFGIKVLSAAAPALDNLAGIAERVFDRLTPSIDTAMGALSAYWFATVELAGAAFDAIGEAIDAVAKWGQETLGWAATSTEAGQQVFDVFRTLAKGAGYVWDVIKAGAGVVATVAGFIVQGFGKVVEALKGAVDLAKKLPDNLRPSWLNGFSDGLGTFSGKLDTAGRGLREWGKGTFDSFGKSAEQAAKWMDGVEMRFNQTKARLGGGAAWDGKLSGAFQKNSVEAYSIVAKNAAGNMAAATDPNRQNGRKIDETNRLLMDIRKALESGGVLKVI